MFHINQQLLADCHNLGLLNDIHVLLHKNASLHWFILVPKTQHKNLFDIEKEQLNSVMNNAHLINDYLIKTLNYSKTNFASIGNVVDQCHIHIVGRNKDDACWPQPVWGNLPDGPSYDPIHIKQIVNDLNIL